VTEGPRVYVERIEIGGNTRTKDKVIRREFRLAEGDAFNAALLRRTQQRLKDLNFFDSAALTTQPGSTPDRAIINAQMAEKATGELTVGGGYSTDIGALVSFGIHERNLVGTGLNAGLDATLAQKESQVNIGLTDPYFLDRNIVTSANVFLVNNSNSTIANYDERRVGFSLSAGYEFNDHLRQTWMYSLVQRSIYDIQTGASLYVWNAAGVTLMSQVGQTLTLDYTDSRLDPRQGWLMRFGTDFAGLGGDVHYVRTKVDGEYFIPLDRWFGSNDWDIAITAGTGYLFSFDGQEQIIDRFFLGGDNLRGFQTAGAGPHSVPTNTYPDNDSLGGRFIWTQSTELRFPLPVSPDLGLSGRMFVDMGGLSQVSSLTLSGVRQPLVDSAAPRIGTGIGFSWKTPFGLINLDFAQAVLKQKYDETQFFRLGFGTRF
jgi:outer membrane protein insertion porin family